MIDAAGQAVVLGGTGFIGSYLVQELLDRGWGVRVVARSAVPLDRRRYPPERLQYVEANLADTTRLASILAGADLVAHLAHATVPGESMADPAREITETVVPTVRLLAALRPGSVRRMLYISSGGTVYGRARVIPTPEDHPTHPVSAYGIAKLTLEKYVQLFGATGGGTTALVRPSNVYGLGQSGARMQGAIGIFLDRLLRGEPIHVWGDGSTVRDYLHVEDLSAALGLIATDTTSAIWNVGSGVGWSLRDVIALLEQVTGRQATVVYGPARGYDVPTSVLDSTRLNTALHWKPAISLEAGVRRLYTGVLCGQTQPPVAWRGAMPSSGPSREAAQSRG